MNNKKDIDDTDHILKWSFDPMNIKNYDFDLSNWSFSSSTDMSKAFSPKVGVPKDNKEAENE